MDFGGGDEIRFERLGRAGVITLTRPKALNAITHNMVKALGKALDAWEQDASVNVVVVKAEGRAFCAGGDILQVYEGGRAAMTKCSPSGARNTSSTPASRAIRSPMSR